MPQTGKRVCPTCHEQGKEHTLHATNSCIDDSAEIAYSQVQAMLLLMPSVTQGGDSCLCRDTMHETKTGHACGVSYMCSASYIVQDTVV